MVVLLLFAWFLVVLVGTRGGKTEDNQRRRSRVEEVKGEDSKKGNMYFCLPHEICAVKVFRKKCGEKLEV